MPTYDFACLNCDLSIEIVQSIYEGAPKDPLCERCGNRLIRSYNAPAIQFKGGGFYSTSSRG